MKCPNCNGEIEEGQKFCNHCGTPVTGKKTTGNKSTGNKSTKPKKSDKKKTIFPIGIGILCILIIAFVGFMAAPKQTTASKLQEKLDLGNNYLEKADYAKAKAAFKEALEIDEKSPEAALGMADAYNGEKKPDKALKYLKKASQNVKVASQKKDTKQVPQNTTEFTKRYEKACDTTAKQYAANNNSQKLQETEKIIKEFKTIVIYVPDQNSDSTYDDEDSSSTENIEEPSSTDGGEEESGQAGSEDPIPTDGGEEESGQAGSENPIPTDGDEEESGQAGSEDPAPTGEDEEPVSLIDITEMPTPAVTEIPTETPTPTVTPVPEETPIDLENGAEVNVFDENTTDMVPTPGEMYVFDPETGSGSYENPEPQPGTESAESPEPEPGTELGESPEPRPETESAENPEPQLGTQENVENVGESGEEDLYVMPEGTENQRGESDSTAENEENPESPAEGNGETGNSEDILRDYAQNNLRMTGFDGTSMTCTYGDNSAVNGVLNGFIGAQITDLNKDEIPELLAVSMNNGRLSFTVYKDNNGVVEAGGLVTAKCDGTGIPLSDYSYGFTQECFMKDNGDSYIVGLASYIYGADAGDGTPAARTSVEAYKISADGNADYLTATTIQNGVFVYSDGNAGNAQAGGQEVFAASLGAVGLSGSWNEPNTATLESMNLQENPYQDMEGVPNPLAAGLGASEAGIQDLVIFNGNMGAGTGNLSFGVQDYTTLAE